MTALLTASPNPATPSSTVVASGTGFTDGVQTRLVLGNKTVSGTFYTTSGVFDMPVQIGARSRRTQSLLAQQKPGKAWTFVAGTTLIVQSTPPAPKILTYAAAPVGTTTTTVSWTLDQPATAQVEYGPVTSPQTFPSRTTLDPNYSATRSQNLTGLSAGTAYAYRILSGNASGSAPLVERTFSTLATAPSVPGAPTSLTAIAGPTVVDLAWVAPASNGGSAITAYKVNRGGVLIATIGPVLFFHDTGRTNGVSYTYTVQAVNVAGTGTASSSASATPAALTPSSPITVTTNNVTIADKSFTAATGNGSTNTGSAIQATGTAGSPIDNLTIRHCTISGFSLGIYLRHVTNLTIEDCTIEDVDYAGIALFSGITGTVQRNTIRRIGYTRTDFNDAAFQNNAYGVMLNRNESASLTTDPQSNAISVLNNLVEDVPLWMGLNTHGGIGHIFRGNTVRRCPRAIFVAGSPFPSTPTLVHPQNITIDANHLEQSVTKTGGTTSQIAIMTAGVAGGSITNNVISATYSADIYDYSGEGNGASTGLTISGNTATP